MFLLVQAHPGSPGQRAVKLLLLLLLFRCLEMDTELTGCHLFWKQPFVIFLFTVNLQTSMCVVGLVSYDSRILSRILGHSEPEKDGTLLCCLIYSISVFCVL